MKINFKHVATAALAVAMSLSLAVPAFAEPAAPTLVANGSLTVTGDQLIGKNVTAVRMFTARAINNGDNENPNYGYDSYTLEDGWLDFFQSEDYFEVADYSEVSENVTELTDVTADDALAYTQALTNTTEIAAFAHNAQKWYRENTKEGAEEKIKEKLVALTTDQKAISVDPGNEKETKGKAVFTDLTAGYYLVFPEGGSTGDNIQGTDTPRDTDAMLINIPTDEQGATWNIKSTYPTVGKKVDTDGDGAESNPAADNGSAQVGDIVTFTLTSKVPDMSDYAKFYFAFNDTLSNGLKVVDNAGKDVADGDNLTIGGLTVTIGGKTVTGGYTVNLDGKVLKVEFENLKAATVEGGTIATGNPIVVTYKAMITKEAVVGTPALNTVKVEYSNDPTTDTKGESTPDESKVYTYEISVNKYASDVANLAGAKFKLTTDKEGNNVVKLFATDAAQSDGTHNAYRVAEPGEESSVTEFVTNSFGDINIAGLKAGTYYLHEIAAPTGYNKLKDPITIVITMDNDPNPGDATITVDNKPATGGDGTTVDVLNKKGIELPETGSIGTIGLTVAGVAIVLLGVFAPRKKKKSNQE